MRTHTPDLHPEAPRAWSRRPRTRAMTRRQVECVLERNHVARVAFVHDGRVELRPVHYVYNCGIFFGRSASGTKTNAWHGRPEVVLEIDEIEETFKWRCVIARGTIALLKPRGTRDDRDAYWAAVSILRSLVPGTLTERDATPDRTFVFRVEPFEITGREMGR